MNLHIYTDGSYWKGIGAWAYVMVAHRPEQDYVITGAAPVFGTTNNRMEMQAVIEAAKRLIEIGLTIEELTLITDSQYTMNMLSGKWKVKEATKNKDLIELWTVVKTQLKVKSLKWEWVRGHDGNKYNELADELCNGERERAQASQSNQG